MAAAVDCSVCIVAYPCNKKNTWYHRLALQVAKTFAKRLLKSLDDVMECGKTFDTKTMTDWESSPAPKRWTGGGPAKPYCRYKGRTGQKGMAILLGGPPPVDVRSA